MKLTKWGGSRFPKPQKAYIAVIVPVSNKDGTVTVFPDSIPMNKF